MRWSLEEEIAKLFQPALEYALVRWEGVSCSISPCPIEDADYLWYVYILVQHFYSLLNDTSTNSLLHLVIAQVSWRHGLSSVFI